MIFKGKAIQKITKGVYTHQKPVGVTCSHLDQIGDVVPQSQGCQDCLAIGDSWLHLRVCMTCGHVGCCNDSKNKHAEEHFHSTHHPIVRTFERNEDWLWCYEDEVFFY